jgi:hypothetical protein
MMKNTDESNDEILHVPVSRLFESCVSSSKNIINEDLSIHDRNKHNNQVLKTIHESMMKNTDESNDEILYVSVSRLFESCASSSLENGNLFLG